MLINEFHLGYKQSDDAYKYGQIIANGIKFCTQDAGYFIFPGKKSVNQVGKETYAKQPFEYIKLTGNDQYQ